MKQKIIQWFATGLYESFKKGELNWRTRMIARQVARRINKMETSEKKSWWKSKTLLVNALTIVASGLTFLASPDAKMDAQTVGTIGTVLALINMVLRTITTKELSK